MEDRGRVPSATGGFEFRAAPGAAVCLMRALAAELEEADEFGGIVFYWHAVDSFASYSAYAAIAALTLPAVGAFT